jgi:Ca2+-binding EF-hand superfamily protein
MKTKPFLLTTAAALSFGAFTLLAQDKAPATPPAGGEGKPPGGEGRPPGPPPGGGDRLAEFIKRADTDGDGKISKEEFVNSTKRESEDRFSKTDTNNDGVVDRAEIEEAGRKMREMGGRPSGEGGPNMHRPEGPDGGFRRPEGSGDGARPRPGQDGKSGDKPSGDGFRRPEGGDSGFRRPEGSGGDGFRRGGGMGGMTEDMLKRMGDKNGDGNITKDEYISNADERFAQMDENKDGKVTKEEVEAAGRRMREMMGGGRPGEGGPGGFRRPEGDGKGARPEGDRPKRPEGEAPAPPKE